jgi:AmiR/NasT family two-component response regulator
MARILKGENIKTPIIFLTNLSDVDHIAKAEETVMSDYIIKSNISVEKIIEMAKNKLDMK